jgi:hypothetical protein
MAGNDTNDSLRKDYVSREKYRIRSTNRVPEFSVGMAYDSLPWRERRERCGRGVWSGGVRAA